MFLYECFVNLLYHYASLRSAVVMGADFAQLLMWLSVPTQAKNRLQNCFRFLAYARRN